MAKLASERTGQAMAHLPDYMLPGALVRRLMRKHGVTIRCLAQQFNITMKRVREVRTEGARGFAANEWHYMITGVWLDSQNN
jgi:hypothetical protein